MRILALVPPGTNSRSQFSELLRGAQLAGHEVLFEDVTQFVAAHISLSKASAGKPDERTLRHQSSYARAVEHTFRARRCDVLAGLWNDPLHILPWVRIRETGQMRSFLQMLGIPMIHWWLDAPFWASQGRSVGMFDRSVMTWPGHIHVVNNEGTAAEMRRILNFSSVIAQPYGVDEATFRPWPVPRKMYDLAINTGPGDAPPTARMLAEVERPNPDIAGIRAEQAWTARSAVLEALRASDEGKGPPGEALADALLAEQMRDPDRPMLEKFDAARVAAGSPDSLIAALTQSPRSAPLWAALTAGLRQIDSWQRAFTAAWLSRRFKCVTIGNGQAAAARQGWDIRGDSLGDVGYHELSLYYSTSHAALNVMRYQDDVGLNPKVLEIAASGCVPLQRWRAGIDQLFTEGREILTFRTPDEAAEKLASLLADPPRAQAISRAAVERVRSSHTWQTRAAQLFSAVESILREHRLPAAPASAPDPTA
ncbi:MAG: glycosyltransferase [Planctomycetota bacterium]|nr:glycosyltransferase [Planctomycetota bacterium]